MIVGGVGGTRCDETSRAKEKRIREEVGGREKKRFVSKVEREEIVECACVRVVSVINNVIYKEAALAVGGAVGGVEVESVVCRCNECVRGRIPG